MKKTTDATAVDVATVDEKMVRKARIPRTFFWARLANARPTMIPTGTVNRTKKDGAAEVAGELRGTEHLGVLLEADVVRGQVWRRRGQEETQVGGLHQGVEDEHPERSRGPAESTGSRAPASRTLRMKRGVTDVTLRSLLLDPPQTRSL